MREYEIAVVGGGASGLMAAVSAAEELRSRQNPGSVVILEGNRKLGKKLAVTGNGRCNLTNEALSPQQYRGDGAFLASLLGRFPPEKIREIFAGYGLLTRADGEGRVYPRSLQAAAVLEVLENRAEALGVECKLEFPVFSVIKPGEAFVLKSQSGEELRAKRCILACGGMASPRHSCGQEGYAVLRALGHSVTPLYPALVQLTSSDKFLKNLPGVRCRVDLALFRGDRCLGEESGELLFAEKALSGICVFQLSLAAAEHFAGSSEPLELRVDFLPELSREEILRFLRELKQRQPRLKGGSFLSGAVPMKLGREIMRACGVDFLREAGSFSDRTLEAIAEHLKGTSLTVNGTKGFEEAQITAGGVPTEELEPETMGSRLVEGLFLCGELLNVHGPCGGYNLHFAWASGIAAGRAAARSLLAETGKETELD